MLRHSNLCHEFQINEPCFEVSLFADDTVIYVESSILQFECMLDITNNFFTKSGCACNYCGHIMFFLY